MDFQENTDVQDGKWQVMRWEDEFTTGMGRPRWEVAGKFLSIPSDSFKFF